MTQEIKYPFYARLAFILLSLSLIIAFLYLGKEIFIPILLALLIAILLRPVSNFLNLKLKFPPVIAVMVAVLSLLLVITGILFFISWKIGDIADDWWKIKSNLHIHYRNIQHWVKQTIHISYRQQEKYVEQAKQNSLEGGDAIGNTMSSFTTILVNLLLVPVYTFLFLIYKDLFIKFLNKLFAKEHHEQLKDILIQVKLAIQNYLVGILIEVGIVSALTSIGLMIIGVQYALLLGVITGILNLIPYVGILIAGALSIFATLTTSTDLHIVIGVIVVNMIVQLIDNNVLVPLVVSSKVKINGFVSIVGIIIGGAIAGVAGMFIAIPLIAIMKIVFDRIDGLKPWGFVMGDDSEPEKIRSSKILQHKIENTVKANDNIPDDPIDKGDKIEKE